MQKHLFKNFHVNVTEAANGEEALKLIKNPRPDLIVCDISNGVEFMRKIKEDKVYQKIPIIMVADEYHLEAQEQALTSGANYFIIKNKILKEDYLQKVRDLIQVPHQV